MIMVTSQIDQVNTLSKKVTQQFLNLKNYWLIIDFCYQLFLLLILEPVVSMLRFFQLHDHSKN